MNFRLFAAFVLGLTFTSASHSQNTPASPKADTTGGARGGRFGQRAGTGGTGGIMGRGVTGTVTEVTADHYSVKSQTGETYTVHYSVNTRFMKQTATAPGQGGAQPDGQGQRRNQRNNTDAGQAGSQGGGQGGPANAQNRVFGGGNPPQPIKPTDIKVGDAIAAMGEIDATAKSVGAIAVLQLDPERAKQMQQLEANYGKTWLMGKVTGVNELQVTLQGSVDNAPHTFVADENTSFRERNNPITLADIHVDDIVRVEGALKDGAFTAATVNVMRPPADGARVPRNAPPPQ